jgi:thiol-disulfide isomerase/thioredoxin
MSLTPSSMPDLGSPMPAFELPNIAGQLISPANFVGSKALLVVFWCNHCPYVQHLRDGFIAFARDYQINGLAIVAICANDVTTHPDDSPELMKIESELHGYCYPYLYDETQQVARAFEAACTPDFFLYDEQRRLVYRGQFDSSRPGNNTPVTGSDLRRAVDALISNQPVSDEQIPSIGCNIKWKPGNEPL